ncbi:MAG: HDOD domain-containing protein [Planctomycetaceae bacterium]
MKPATLEQILSSDRLPSLPQVALRVIELAAEEEPNFNEVIKTVRTDPALASRIMKLANSALFGLGKPVASVDAAIPLLGMTMVRTIVLGFTLSDTRAEDRDVQLVMQKLWRSSLTQAVCAEQLAEETSGADPATYFLAGLLQDLGILSFLHVDGETYLDHVWDKSEFPNVIAAERTVYGFTHIDVAIALCERWGIPEEIRNAILVHHQHMQSGSSSKRKPLATALQAAALSGHYSVNHRTSRRAMDNLYGFLRQHFKWQPKRIEEFMEETTMRVCEAAALFSFELGKTYTPERVLSDAKQLLEDIALQSQMRMVQSGKSGGRDESLEDPMTQTYNRRFMDRVLNEELSTNIRKRKPVGLLFLDIDRFKSINDQFGHNAGDEAICEVARVLNAAVRKSDFVIRFGGDEFLVALMDAKGDTVETIAERIRCEIAAAAVEDSAIKMTTSVGALHYTPAKGDTADSNWLIDYADKAMYEAKRNGGDQVCLYEIKGRSEVATRLLVPVA